jgi:ABC-type sugar transport system ATPase subunit
MTEGVAGVVVDRVEKRYPHARRKALSEVSLEVPPGSFFSILGPSGCGKTTLLRVIAGFEQPSAGRVLIGGVDVTGIPPRDRDIAMVFQDYALYPHMTVRQNMTFNLRNRRVPHREIEERLGRTAGMLGIDNYLDKLPAQLSGGERQRVALGRALIRQPRVFLMDEPLSNLDLKLRETMRLELGRLHQRLGITTVFVTHDQTEAMTLSTAIAVMSQGELQQVGGPEDIYARPVNIFVGTFIGSPTMNMFRASHVDGKLVLAGGAVSLAVPGLAGLASGQPVLIGARPHEVSLAPGGPGRLPVRVSFTERLGRSNFVICVPQAGADILESGEAIQVETEAGTVLPQGTETSLDFDVAALKLFDAAGHALECRPPSQGAEEREGLSKDAASASIGAADPGPPRSVA